MVRSLVVLLGRIISRDLPKRKAVSKSVGWVERSETHHFTAGRATCSDMTSYRRNFVEGGSFFFTVNLPDRRRRLLVEHIDLLGRAFREVHERHPFSTEAIVVLPDHLHAIWTLPDGDRDFSVRWRLVKAMFLTLSAVR
jgi:hypothetical protein